MCILCRMADGDAAKSDVYAIVVPAAVNGCLLLKARKDAANFYE